MQRVDSIENHSNTDLFSKIISCLKQDTSKSVSVLNLAHPSISPASCQITENPGVLSSYTAFIIQEIQKKIYDLIMDIDYPLLDQSDMAVEEIIECIANNSAVSVYKFPSFQTYFSKLSFKKIYKYREIIETKNQSIYVFCSNQYWYAGGRMSAFEPQTKLTRERVGTVDGVRRYYVNSSRLLKYYELNGNAGDHIKREIQAEARFLEQDNASSGFAPKLIDFKINEYEGWILREKAPGITLSEILDENEYYDPVAVFNNTLQQVIMLEEKNLIHIKLRPRNIIVLEAGGSLLVDYGAITHKNKQKFYLSGYYGFLMLSYEIFHRRHMPQREFSPIYLIENATWQPQYRRWLNLILSYPTKSWNFKLFAELFEKSDSAEHNHNMDYDLFQKWLCNLQKRIENKKIRSYRFESLLARKINSYTSQYSFKNRVIDFLWQNYIALYDKFRY